MRRYECGAETAIDSGYSRLINLVLHWNFSGE